MKKSHLITENFFSEALELRNQFESHFATPHIREGDGTPHQIWDYWYVPQLYTYLRSRPHKLFNPELFEQFYQQLLQWSIQTLGLSNVSRPFVSLYINGCGQGLHNDAKNGRFGYVYSLTPWEKRTFTGGETLLFKDEHYWESEKIREKAAGINFYELIAPQFNQLLVFDDRLIHAVQPLQGTMNPLEGRLVIHGHIREGGIIVQGGLTPEQVDKVFATAMPVIMAKAHQFGPYYHGLLSLRLAVNQDGEVQDIRALTDRILKTSPRAQDSKTVVEEIVNYLQTLLFPDADDVTYISVPIHLE